MVEASRLAVKCLAQEHGKRLKRTCRSRLDIHNMPLMLNAKQGSCEHQLFKYFGLTRRENRTQVYRLQGRHSNYYINESDWLRLMSKIKTAFVFEHL